MSDAVDVADHPEESRYQATLEGAVVGVAAYRLTGNVITFTHTEVDPAFAGQGVGGQLARFALDDARARGLRVHPRCSFMRSFIKGHPVYADLVDAGHLN
jgi:predicted GNAT family acetyltransferase